MSSPDATIFDIGALALPSDADTAADAAALDGDESDATADTQFSSASAASATQGGLPASAAGTTQGGLPPLRRPALGRVSFGGGDAAGALAGGAASPQGLGGTGGGGGGQHWAGPHGELQTPRTPGGGEALRRSVLRILYLPSYNLRMWECEALALDVQRVNVTNMWGRKEHGPILESVLKLPGAMC